MRFGLQPNDLLIEAIKSVLGQTTPSSMGQLPAPRMSSVPLPSSTQVFEGQNLVVDQDVGMSCFPGGLAFIEGIPFPRYEEPISDFEQDWQPPFTSAATCEPNRSSLIEARQEWEHVLPSTVSREQVMGFWIPERPLSEPYTRDYQEPDATDVCFDHILPTSEPSPVRSNFPSQPEQPMGRKPSFQWYQEPHAGSSQVNDMLPTPTPSPSQPEQQVGRGPERSRSRRTPMEGDEHLFEERMEGSPKKLVYYCVDNRCTGRTRIRRKQDCDRHAKKAAGAAIFNCTYPDREREGCNYRGNFRSDKVWEHERNQHGYHRGKCACMGCKAKGKADKWA